MSLDISQLDAPATPATVAALYRLLLGRNPEDADVVAAATGRPLALLIQDFLASEERARQEVAALTDRFRTAWPSGEIDVEAKPDELDALFEAARRTWVRLGAEEPYWSVMTDPAYKGEAMDAQAEARFFQSGGEDVRVFLEACRRNALTPPHDGTVLDFGCGVGRLGVHLARVFQTYHGVDISPPHLIEARRRLEMFGARASFSLLDDFIAADQTYDCLFSVLVLQHNAPPVMAELLSRLVTRLRPGGIGYVQIPYAVHDYRYSARAHIADPSPVGQMEMHALPHRTVFQLLQQGGARPVEAIADGRAGAAGLSTTWLFAKD